MTSLIPAWLRSPFRARPVDERMRSLKERVYASFTGLSVVTVMALAAEHPTPPNAFVTLAAAIVGISIAGFVAEALAHLVSHKSLPGRAETTTMIRIAGGALASASVPLLALLAAWMGWIPVELALQTGIGIYFFTLAAVALVAAHRTGLPWRQQVLALAGLVGLGALVVGVLAVAHGLGIGGH
ncbi:hypothetical protein [Herbiconiux sp. YIM B11900]|uniref:hypothetical protein n=1 Tax=Herbiconiux sp. YIM B11900 TaxID=3404131 RepID=UPI003F84B464